MEENAELVISEPQALENARKDLRNIKGEITYGSDFMKKDIVSVNLLDCFLHSML